MGPRGTENKSDLLKPKILSKSEPELEPSSAEAVPCPCSATLCPRRKGRHLCAGCKQLALYTERLIPPHFILLLRKSRDVGRDHALPCILRTSISRDPRIHLLPRQSKAWGTRLSLLSSWAGQVNHMAVPIRNPGQGCTGLTRLPLQSKRYWVKGFLGSRPWDLDLQKVASSAEWGMSLERRGAQQRDGEHGEKEDGSIYVAKSQNSPHRLQRIQDLE